MRVTRIGRLAERCFKVGHNKIRTGKIPLQTRETGGIIHATVLLLCGIDLRQVLHQIPGKDQRHVLLLRLFSPFDEGVWEALVQRNCFHKLSYKFAEEMKTKPGTYYAHLMNNGLPQ